MITNTAVYVSLFIAAMLLIIYYTIRAIDKKKDFIYLVYETKDDVLRRIADMIKQLKIRSKYNKKIPTLSGKFGEYLDQLYYNSAFVFMIVHGNQKGMSYWRESNGQNTVITQYVNDNWWPRESHDSCFFVFGCYSSFAYPGYSLKSRIGSYIGFTSQIEINMVNHNSEKRFGEFINRVYNSYATHKSTDEQLAIMIKAIYRDSILKLQNTKNKHKDDYYTQLTMMEQLDSLTFFSLIR